jgi:hypothetical protein
MTPRQALDKIWLRRCAHRVKPATDVHLGVSFTAVMPGSGRTGGFRIPSVDGEVGISTSNHEPVGGAGGNESTNFTPEFPQCCHTLCSVNSVMLTSRSGLGADLVSALSVRRLVLSSRYRESGRLLPDATDGTAQTQCVLDERLTTGFAVLILVLTASLRQEPCKVAPGFDTHRLAPGREQSRR